METTEHGTTQHATTEHATTEHGPQGDLTSGGRTLAQGALAWLWARSPRTVPIPGFRSVDQAEENAGAIAEGPLTAGQLAEIDRLLGR
ncbi:hypothetical protein GCM10011579_075500 [Streptomyces albiflavescens]|uniref:NADP-dependent oxidoreductase domain-containing protein n=1 Tax=Streptomyces albiflavescens TaxID=1623582 RepID=A0A917YB16_9ACTN|nr:hypothetical protein GCM10011579_075500 [Streptomyces albiflavescens]